jgi:lipoprotein-releasing system ATP-binding protein
VLEGRRIERVFQLGPDRIDVLQGVDVAVRRGEMVAVVGPSGSGKSTLLNVLAGLDRPSGGDVFLGGVSLAAFRDEDLARFRNRNVGLLFQFHHLLPEFSVLENVMMPCLIAGDARSEARARAEAALCDVGFTSRMRHRPAELSGGEKQKVATARALVMDPLVVLADEPTGNLDFYSARTLMELFRRLNRERRVTMLIVSHNERVAGMCGRRLCLSEGRLEEAARGRSEAGSEGGPLPGCRL